MDHVGDLVIEAPREGSADLVNAGVGFTLGDNLERLVLTGSSSIDGAGNGLDNSLTGNAGANRLDGGAASDTMAGGAGDDSCAVDRTSDVVTEKSSAGTDTVLASVGLTLGSNLEHLVLTGSASTGGTGNNLANRITGNDGAKALSGGKGNDTIAGGLGADTLTGGSGSDVFRFGSPGEGADRIGDLSAGSDKIQVVSANFDNLALGALSPTRFLTGGAMPTTGDAVFLYNASTGVLAFDADGNGAAVSTQIAVLTGSMTLGAANIQVVAA